MKLFSAFLSIIGLAELRPRMVRNEAAAASVLIPLYGSIGYEIMSADVLAQIIAAGDKPILVRINSGGGDMFEAYAIFNALKNHAAGVEVEIDGIAASAASYIAMAGGKIRMAENALIMIHNPTSWSSGDAESMRSQADLLDKVKASLVSAYQARTGIEEGVLNTMLDEETYLSATEALEKKFIDEIIDPIAAALKFKFANFKKPERIAALLAERPKTSDLRSQVTAAEQRAVAADLRATKAEGLLSGAENRAVLAEQRATKAEGERDTARTTRDAVLNNVASVLALTGDSLAKLQAGDVTIVPIEIERIVSKKAVTLIASQGHPGLKTKPSSPGAAGDAPKSTAEHNQRAIANLLNN